MELLRRTAPAPDDPEKVRDALELLRRSERWVRRVEALDGQGYPVNPSSVRAERWCAVGALRKCGVSDAGIRFVGGVAEEYLRDVHGRTNVPGPITEVNDRYGHTDVVNVLTNAVARFEEAGS